LGFQAVLDVTKGPIGARFTAAADAMPNNKVCCKLLIDGFLRELKGDSSAYAELLSSAISEPSRAAAVPAPPTPAVSMTQSGTNSQQQHQANASSVRAANTALLSAQDVLTHLKRQYEKAFSMKVEDTVWDKLWADV
jgi:hypothetical protein